MAVQNKATIKSYFETGDRPTQAQFVDLVDSYMDVSAVVAAGTVTSAGLSMPGIFAVAGSPITSAGVFTVTLSAQAPAQIFASPASASGTPTFRSILASDLGSAGVPSLGTSNTWTALQNFSSGITVNPGGATFDNYTTGSFTPTLVGLSTAGAPTYVTQFGIYRRYANGIFVSARIILSNLGGMTGQLAMNGLPITVESSSLYAFATGEYANFNAAITTAPICQASGGTSQVRFFKDGAGSSAVLSSSADTTNTLSINFAGFIPI